MKIGREALCYKPILERNCVDHWHALLLLVLMTWMLVLILGVSDVLREELTRTRELLMILSRSF